jgi:hypothetical protein
MLRFAVKNAPVDWGSPPPKEQPERVDSIARFVVHRAAADGEAEKGLVKRVKTEKTEKEKEKPAARGRSVADMLRAEGEACPVCQTVVAPASMNAHVNRHFEEKLEIEHPKKEDKEKRKKKKKKEKRGGKEGALDKFLARKHDET